MWCASEWEYKVVKDEFFLYFPEGDYNIGTLLEWYKVVPTNPNTIAYYGDNVELLKRHFERFSQFDDVHTKNGNDFHSNPLLYVHCMAVYNSESELVGFAAQEYIEGKAADKKFLYLNELK